LNGCYLGITNAIDQSESSIPQSHVINRDNEQLGEPNSNTMAITRIKHRDQKGK